MKRKTLASKFTFIEVVIAVAILAVAFTSLLTLSGTASAKIAKARREWSDAHRTIQALEYFLLAGNNSNGIPSEIFPYSDTYVNFSIVEPQGLTEQVETTFNGWCLAGAKVTLTDDSGRTISSLVVEKILREDDR